MSRRFYAPEVKPESTFELLGEEAHHVHNVMRFKPGDNVRLFDGTGTEYPAVIVATSKKSIQLEVGKASQIDALPSLSLTVAVSLPKGDRQKFLVEKLVELGCNQLLPLKTERSVADANAKVVSRVEKQIVEACKQCERNRLMRVSSQIPLRKLAEHEAFLEADKTYIATPRIDRHLANESFAESSRVLIAIGPEGGFSPSEQEFAEQLGLMPISLSNGVLRIETAAIAATVLVANGS